MMVLYMVIYYVPIHDKENWLSCDKFALPHMTKTPSRVGTPNVRTQEVKRCRRRKATLYHGEAE